MKKVLLSVITLGAISINAYAGCVAGSCTGKVETIYMTAGGTLYVGTDGDEGALNCTAPAGKYMSLKEGDVGKNAMYSLLLTAKTTGAEVAIRVVEGSPDCQVAYVTTK